MAEAKDHQRPVRTEFLWEERITSGGARATGRRLSNRSRGVAIGIPGTRGDWALGKCKRAHSPITDVSIRSGQPSFFLGAALASSDFGLGVTAFLDAVFFGGAFFGEAFFSASGFFAFGGVVLFLAA